MKQIENEEKLNYYKIPIETENKFISGIVLVWCLRRRRLGA